jgi:hypothetical protein
MNKRILSKRHAKASLALQKDSVALSFEEKDRIKAQQLELYDETIVLKTFYAAGEEQELLSANKNNTPRRGVVDFQDGRLITQDGGGTLAVDAIKISHAAGIKDEDPAAKSYIQTGFPDHLENSLVELHQNGTTLRKIKISEFAFKGDEPQTTMDQWKELDRPIVIAAGTQLKIRLLRPENFPGAGGFISIEMKGMQTFEKRTRR